LADGLYNSLYYHTSRDMQHGFKNSPNNMSYINVRKSNVWLWVLASNIVKIVPN